MSEFLDKRWKSRGLEELLKKLWDTGTIEQKKESGRPRSAHIEENVSSVEELAVSHQGQPQRHRSIVPYASYREKWVFTSHPSCVLSMMILV